LANRKKKDKLLVSEMEGSGLEGVVQYGAITYACYVSSLTLGEWGADGREDMLHTLQTFWR
jgi:hypothetical protein